MSQLKYKRGDLVGVFSDGTWSFIDGKMGQVTETWDSASLLYGDRDSLKGKYLIDLPGPRNQTWVREDHLVPVQRCPECENRFASRDDYICESCRNQL